MSPVRIMIGIISVVIILGVVWPLISMAWNKTHNKSGKKVRRIPGGVAHELVNWLNLIILILSPAIIIFALALILVVLALTLMLVLMLMLLVGIPVLFAHTIQLIIQGNISAYQLSVPPESGPTSGLLFGGE